jgi:hypothetical protein
MAAMSPTRTTNRLHFTDLDPTRFEDFCLALVFSLHAWVDIQHYGRLGADGGVDILAKEQMDDESTRSWFVQCRRYSRATKSTLKKAVDDALSKARSVPDVLLVVLACDIRRDTHEEYARYALGKGITTPMLWTASSLEARLYAERKDLLFTYFGISAAQQGRSQEISTRRSLAMKRRVARELMKTKLSVEDTKHGPWGKFVDSEAIIHSVDDTSYPEIANESVGISGWFKLEFCDLYHNGVEFLSRVEMAAADSQGRWAILPYDEVIDDATLRSFRVYRVGRLPYRNIVEIDTLGDEYYRCPHIYCRFADGGQPWERFVYRLVSGEKEYPTHLDRSDQVSFDDLVSRK